MNDITLHYHDNNINIYIIIVKDLKFIFYR